MRSDRSKRLLDIIGAGTGLIVLAPLLAVIALAVYVNDRGPIIFRQTRVGQNGREFRMLKFRSMLPHAEQHGGLLTVGKDQRITRIGTCLRRFKLDELPQLVNVLVGEMSLVGPRPEVRRYVDLYSPAQRRVLDLRPGITDPASLEYYDEAAHLVQAKDPEATYVNEIMPRKIAMNLAYAGNASVWSDIGLIVRTLLHPMLARSTNADERDALHRSG